jgi:hypothetical protein
MDSMLGGQLFAPAVPPGTVRAPYDAPVVREVVEDWLRRHAGHIRADDFVEAGHPRLTFDGSTAGCTSQ